MNGNGADGIINAQPFQQFNPKNHENTGNATQENGARGADPVAGTGDGN